LSLAALARRIGGSPYHLQRNFKRIVGLSPREYAEACRLKKVKRRLREGQAITDAMFESGYGSSSRFYERAAPAFGMSPSTYRRGGDGLQVRYTIVDSVLGRLLVAGTGKGICSVAMSESDRTLERALADEYPAASISRDDDQLRAWAETVADLTAGAAPRKDLPLDIRATAFQWQVWKALRQIPAGETRTYAEVARAIGHPRAVRAVGHACATNPVALVIPCHRVVPASGGIGNYRWGPERKKTLLEREAKKSR
jgi:AraC family transcriptional regulator of adaptative response/methylated-DNA-[protein]-cysteine methyltransferase